jgi:hypothetical protein
MDKGVLDIKDGMKGVFCLTVTGDFFVFSGLIMGIMGYGWQNRRDFVL